MWTWPCIPVDRCGHLKKKRQQVLLSWSTNLSYVQRKLSPLHGHKYIWSLGAYAPLNLKRKHWFYERRSLWARLFEKREALKIWVRNESGFNLLALQTIANKVKLVQPGRLSMLLIQLCDPIFVFFFCPRHRYNSISSVHCVPQSKHERAQANFNQTKLSSSA